MTALTRARRILHVRTVSGTGGGPEKTIMNACRWMNEHGHVSEAFYVLDRRHHPGTIEAMARREGVTFHATMESGPFSLKTLLAFYRILVAGQYDVIHTHDYKANVLAKLFHRIGKYRIIATAHGYNRTTWREAVYYAIERRLFRHLDAVIAPTRQMRRFLLNTGVPRRCITIVPNGVTPFQLQRRSESCSTKRILYLGRLSCEKNPALAVDAVDLLRRRMSNIHLTIAGDGPEHSALVSHVHRLGLESWVSLIGHVAEPRNLLADADVLISPSRTECMPNTILEAMMAHVPVVATAVGGVPEMIRNGIEGVLCERHEAQALADGLFAVLSDEALSRQLTAAAYRRVMTCFTFDARMRRIDELHERLLNVSGAGDPASSDQWARVCREPIQ